jgi:hypothetical protein
MSQQDEQQGESQEAKALPHLASEFFAWIWYTSEARRGTLDLGEGVGAVDFWVGSRISFRAVDEDKARAVVTGESPSTTLEARAALAGGKVVNDLRLVLRREDREYEVTLRGPYLDLHNVRLPAQVKPAAGDGAENKNGEDEILYERMYLYDELWFLLGALYARFAEERTGADWRTETLPSLKAWVGRGRDSEGAYSVA